ncbi:pyrroline-5-carboxylate reductase [Stygiolobus caldivivus]|uniref:Pyrroline-5-carboxylate reductase n=1 Tax=Stygiolobus caldivivus TaxID=2824673 RepID=A0A8D5U7L7_9CREN|nr:pyrroline-5-carboxylate reductase [Stygiolobus caldivivus]BCU70462.1 pyrroline-5-carboxylate reductase [Stygiolobus caldivivus]
MVSISILGAGKIGTAIAKSIKDNFEVIATARSEASLKRIQELGIASTRDNSYAVNKSDIVIISVKPQHFRTLLTEIKPELWIGKKVISVMAGVKLLTLSRLLKGATVFRAMPNINAVVGKATTAISPQKDETVEKIFLSIGNVYWVQEELLDAWTAIIGSGPAFLAEIVDAFALGAVACGMPRELAYDAILDMVEGTVSLLKKCKTHPVFLRDQVTTPAGTTIRGLMVMESEGVKSAIIKTVESAYQRAVTIGKEIDSSVQ